MKKVCNKLELCFDRCEDDARAVLKEKGVPNTTASQKGNGQTRRGTSCKTV